MATSHQAIREKKSIEAKPRHQIVISDYLVDEDMLKIRLADIFKVPEDEIQYGWCDKKYTIYNAPIEKLKPVGHNQILKIMNTNT
jgi:hypothetical protein